MDRCLKIFMHKRNLILTIEEQRFFHFITFVCVDGLKGRVMFYEVSYGLWVSLRYFPLVTRLLNEDLPTSTMKI